MRQSVRDAFFDFTAKLEGVVAWPYLDVLGLVTTGVGNLIDPAELAVDLPWIRAAGYPATASEILAAWDTIKNTASLAKDGYRAAEHLTNIRLTDEGIRALVTSKLDSNWAQLCRRFEQLEEWPADAQLGLCSMAWAAGPAFKAPMFDGHCRAMDFNGAAIECRFNDEHNAGLRPRNDANEILFHNAAHVLEAAMDPELLYYPTLVESQVTIGGDA